jgi:hypothetical protein
MTYRFQVLSAAVCKYYNITEQELHSTSRQMDIVGARRMFYFFARKHFKKTYKSIANYFRANHATVIHHERKMEAFLTFDKNEIKRYIKIRDMVFDENSMIGLQEEYDHLEFEKRLISSRMKEIKLELETIKEEN